MTFRESVLWFLLKLKRAVLYAYLVLWIILCQSLLSALTIAPLGLPALALLVLQRHWQKVECSVKYFVENNRFAQAVSLLIGAGIITWVITTLIKYARDQFVEIWKAVRAFCSAWWCLRWKSLDQLETSWSKYFDTAPCNAWQAFKRAHLLTISLILCVLLVVLYPMFSPKPPSHPAPTVHTTQNIYRYVSVFGATAAEQSREIKLVLRPSAVFSLHHVDARPQEGKGICLDPPQQNLLKEIRKAIENRVAKCKSAPTFEVKGYASVAPMHVDGDTSDSAKLNCKVANWRAAAVGTFLVDPHEYRHEKWCQDAKNIFNQEQLDGCGDFTKPRKGKDANSKPKFLVNIHQWASPSEMIESKPADDGEVPDPRRYDVEILNRVVRIEVPENFCGTAASGAGTP